MEEVKKMSDFTDTIKECVSELIKLCEPYIGTQKVTYSKTGAYVDPAEQDDNPFANIKSFAMDILIAIGDHRNGIVSEIEEIKSILDEKEQPEPARPIDVDPHLARAIDCHKLATRME